MASSGDHATNPTTDTVQRLRAKLWNTGYKLSSKKVEAFLDFIAESAMAETIHEKDGDEDAPGLEENQTASETGLARNQHPDNNIPEDHRSTQPTHTAAATTTADARVDRLERDIQTLEAAITRYTSTNSFPLAIKPPPHIVAAFALQQHRETHEHDQQQQPTKTTPRRDARQSKRETDNSRQQTNKFPKKSDPVAMFHKMQTIWKSNARRRAATNTATNTATKTATNAATNAATRDPPTRPSGRTSAVTPAKARISKT